MKLSAEDLLKAYSSEPERIVRENGDVEWFLNGKLHREDGPAYEPVIGPAQYFINDVKRTIEQYRELIK